ncbi:polymer-forming cytoskeletal protein [Streptococcus thermophilus]|uniref:polymer-forming cytoskeletal protein n=1 Tax=Streptococcus thermophilus TaxID=1308 RepID=UPI003A802179
MIKKFELDLSSKKTVFGIEMFRIRALISFRDVKKGDLGGYVEKEENLSHYGNAWIYDDAQVYGDAMVYDKAWVYGNAKVFSDAQVYGNAEVSGNAKISGNAEVYGNAEVSGNAEVYGNAVVYGDAMVYDKAWVYGNAKVFSDAQVYGNAEVSGNAKISGNAEVYGNAEVSGNAEVYGNAEVSKLNDYIVFKNNWSSGRYFTYTRSNKMWRVGCFYGTEEELVEKAYLDSENSGKHYESYVNLVKTLEKLEK